MKKKSCILFTILLLVGKLYSQDIGVQFVDSLSWNQVKEKAKKENKYIFMDVYATWCGPCKMMDTQVYTDETIGNLLNDKFISIKVQQDQTKNDNIQVKSWYADIKDISIKYKIDVLPSFLFFSSGGKLVHRGLGYQDTTAFRQMVELALTNPLRKLSRQLAAYKKGKRDSAFLRDLAMIAILENDKVTSSMVASTYIRGLRYPYSKENISFIQQFTKKTTDPGFSILIKNLEKVNTILGKDMAELIITSIIANENISPLLQKKATPDWGKIQKDITTRFGLLGEEITMQSQVLYSANRQDWEAIEDIILPWFEKYGSKRLWINDYLLNEMAWAAFSQTENLKVLRAVLIMSEKSIQKDPAANKIDTYANLLYKIGRKQEAIEWEHKAVELSKNEKVFVETLNKMQKGQPTWK
jgi:thioredoxin-related protein